MWIARDKKSCDYSTLHLFTDKPKRYGFDREAPIEECDHWDSELGGNEIPEELFSELKWEDEPKEVIICEKKEYDILQESVTKTYC